MDETLHFNVSGTKTPPAIQQALQSRTEESCSPTLTLFLYSCLGKCYFC